MKSKRFMVVETSGEAVQGDDIFGFLLLAADAELWRVARSSPPYLPPCWSVGEIVEVPVRYSGPDTLQPNWRAVGCQSWQPLLANNPFAAVARHWGDEVARRFVMQESDG